MSGQLMGQQTRRDHTGKRTPAKPTKTPKHNLGQERQKPLQINGSASRFSRYEMAVKKNIKMPIGRDYYDVRFLRRPRSVLAPNGSSSNAPAIIVVGSGTALKSKVAEPVAAP